MFLTEGGNVWDDVGPIKKEYVPGIIKDIQKVMPKGLSIIPHIGSAGFKVQSGDMDVFVDAATVAQLFNAPDEKKAKAALKAYIDKQGLQTALTGRNVHVRMPVPDGSWVQVDVMVIPDAARVAPFHQHGPSGQYADPEFKGGHLFILYSSVAKALGLKFSPFEGKLTNRETGEVVADTKEEVAKALLGPSATPADISSVKAMLNALKTDPNREAKLAQAREDAKKGLIALPESIQEGTTSWFRHLTNTLLETSRTQEITDLSEIHIKRVLSENKIPTVNITEHYSDYADCKKILDSIDELSDTPTVGNQYYMLNMVVTAPINLIDIVTSSSPVTIDGETESSWVFSLNGETFHYQKFRDGNDMFMTCFFFESKEKRDKLITWLQLSLSNWKVKIK